MEHRTQPHPPDVILIDPVMGEAPLPRRPVAPYPRDVPAPVGASLPAHILDLLADGTPRTREQVAQALSVTSDQVGVALAALRQRGLVAIVGYQPPAAGGWGRTRRAVWQRTPPAAP
jgi:DNA-binding transcriptional ArsR family regulator